MSAPAIETLGSALLHFLWQGTALGWRCLWLFRLPATRACAIGLAVGAFALMALCPLGTVAILERAPVPVVSVDYSTVAPAASNITEVLSNAHLFRRLIC